MATLRITKKDSTTPPSIIYDGNTVAWYDYNSSTATMTMTDTSVSRWNDKLGSGHDLLQATGSKQPKWSSRGVFFDGTNDFMKAVFAWSQPAFVYMVIDISSYAPRSYLVDGASDNVMQISKDPSTNGILQWAWNNSGPYPDTSILSTNLQPKTFAVIKALFYDVSSRLTINNQTKSGRLDNVPPNGFTLGAPGLTNSQYNSNITVKEIILRKVADTNANEELIGSYLNNKYFPLKLNLTNNISLPVLADGNTWGWYDYTDLSTLTLTADSSVSSWRDKLGSGRNLTQSNSAYQPKYTATGILLSNNLKNMNYVTSFALPLSIYAVVKQLAWSYTYQIIPISDIYASGINQGWNTPEIRLYAGAAYSAVNSAKSIPIGTYGIIRAVFNQSTSKLQINNGATSFENYGNQNITNIHLGSIDGGGNSANVEFKEIIFRTIQDSLADEVAIYNYLNTKYSINAPTGILNTGFVSPYELESRLYFSRMTVQPTVALKNLLNTTIKNLKINGIWYDIDEFFFFNLHTQQASLLGVKGLKDASTGNSPTWTAKVGFLMAVSGQRYLNTNLIPNVIRANYKLLDAGVYFSRDICTNDVGIQMSGSGNVLNNFTENSAIWGENAASAPFPRFNNTAQTTLGSNYINSNLSIIYRTDDTSAYVFNNSVETGYSALISVAGLPALSFLLGVLWWGGFAQYSSNTTYRQFGIGSALTTAKRLQFQSIINNFNANVASTF